MTKKLHGNCQTREKIESRIDKTGDCWIWTGMVDKDGYGRTSYLSREWFLHRLMYDWYKGPLIPGKVVMHSCDNPPCCNPEHLSQGTIADNNKDCALKGRKPSGSANGSAKLTDYQVECIRALYDLGISMVKLSLMFNVSRLTIRKIINKQAWKDLSPSVEGPPEAWATDSQITADKLNAISVKATKKQLPLSEVPSAEGGQV